MGRFLSDAPTLPGGTRSFYHAGLMLDIRICGGVYADGTTSGLPLELMPSYPPIGFGIFGWRRGTFFIHAPYGRGVVTGWVCLGDARTTLLSALPLLASVPRRSSAFPFPSITSLSCTAAYLKALAELSGL